MVVSLKGLVLAGGRGTRLHPTTRIINKHLIPIYEKPMIFYPIEALRDAGVTDIILSLSHYNPQQFMELLGDGSELGVKLTYTIHGEAKGIAYAINHAQNLLGNEQFACVLGDNIFTNGLKEEVIRAKTFPQISLVLLKEVDYEQAKNYGVAEFEGPFKLKRLVEKPESPPSTFIMLGAYFLTSRFFEVYPTLKQSTRGEYEITDAVNALFPHVIYTVYEGNWFDAGTFDSILEASNFMKEDPLRQYQLEGIKRTLEEMKT